LQPRADRQAVRLGHIDIDDYDVGMASIGLDQCLKAVGRGFDIESHAGAAIGQHFSRLPDRRRRSAFSVVCGLVPTSRSFVHLLLRLQAASLVLDAGEHAIERGPDLFHGAGAIVLEDDRFLK
jgi:hypothetical protein